MNSYGIAGYQETNPGLFAVVTFPFLFAVMFGDIGHGCIIFIAALGMILFEKKLGKMALDEVGSFNWLHIEPDSVHSTLDNGSIFLVSLVDDCYVPVLTVISGRYIILLMGLFSIYTGLMYNDIFSKSLHLWDSGWTFSESSPIGVDNGHRYPFGLDPGWHGTVNGLVFTNSYKMKMSIVLGVIHVRILL